MAVQSMTVGTGMPQALPAAASWFASLVTGSIGQALGVLAIAWVGFAMLQGRMEWRRGALTVAGCFILFGAPVIAKGILAAATGSKAPASRPQSIPSTTIPASAPQFDPYAGAALPH